MAAEPSHGVSAWCELSGAERGIRTLLYERPLPNFGDAVNAATDIRELEAVYAELIEAFRLKLKEERPHVVLVNGTYAVPWCLMLAAHSLQLPVILHYHGSLTKETEHWKEAAAREMLRKIEASFDRRGVKYIFPSVLVKDFVEQQVYRRRLYRKNVVVLPNPIPDEFFSVEPQKSRRRIGFVGRWTRIKNTAFLERFVELNHRAGKPFDIYVLTDAKSRQHAGKRLHDRVRFVSPREESASLAAFYGGMSAIICPSHFETYGNVAQEAVASGTPAYVSRNMGVSEVFERAGLGHLIVDFEKPRAVFEALQNDADLEIPMEVRRALREEAGAAVVHQKLLEYIRT
jgi:glycosyltransferase involved in cell wall biosynthesis